MAKLSNTNFIDIQSTYSEAIEKIRIVNEKVDNLEQARQKAINDGNQDLADKIKKLLDQAEKEKLTLEEQNKLIAEICQELAKLRGIKLEDKTRGELRDEEREKAKQEAEKERENKEKIDKLNAFYGKFGYEFHNNGGNIEKGQFGEGFSGTKKAKDVGEALSMFGGNIGKAGAMITKFAGWIGIAIEAIKLLDNAIAAIADADAKQQDIQNRRNTMLTDRNIELSNIETEGNVDILNNFKDNMLSEYNKLFTQLQGEVALANAKAIASTNAAIEGTIGDINNAAWNALAAQTDIFAQSQKLGLQVAKTNDIENRAIAQRNIELQGRQSERGYQSSQALLKAQRTNAELNIEEQNYAYEHPIATSVNKWVGDGTEANHVRGDNKWNHRHNADVDKYLSNGTYGSEALGIANMITGELLKGTLKSGITVQQTRTKRDLTNASNDLNAAQAENSNRIKVQNTVIANSNEIKNKVIEGVTDIKSSVIDTQVAIEKAYQKMAQSVEKWMMDFQDKVYDSGIGKGMTTRGQLDRYRSSMLTITEDVARKYGLTKEEVIKMQNDYTAEGRSKLLNREDMGQQASFGKIYLGGDFGTAAELANNTEIFNMGISDTVDLMGEMSKIINKMGLDGRKYLKDMVKNLQMAQKYDFKNGVKGMMKMAQWAQNTRFNMDKLPNMIEDIQKGGLEGIITKAAKLQVLGGRFAMGADPIAMAFEAYNDPAALAKRYNSMTMGMGHFNKETGQVEFNGMEQDQMRALAEYSGQSLEDVRKQATYNVKKDRVEGFIKDNTLTQEQKMSLVNKAYYQNGQWKVNDVTGNAVNLSEVNATNIKNIQADTYEGKMEQGMQEIVSFTKLFTGNTEANMAALSSDINKNGAADNELLKRLREEQSDFHKNFDFYSGKVLENMKEATEAYKVFLNTFQEDDPLKSIKSELSNVEGQINTFKTNTFKQLSSILAKLGVNEKGEKTNNVDKPVKPSSNTNNNVPSNLRPIDKKELDEANATLKNSRSSVLYTDKKGVGYGGNFGKGIDIAGARYTHGVQTNNSGEMWKGFAEYFAQPVLNAFGMDADNVDRFFMGEKGKNPKSKVKDGVMNNNGNPMFTQASKVTPINDGNVQIAKSDPKDTAVFAKTGGPFDTLFNDVFGRIDDVYNKVSSDVLPTEPLGHDAIFAEPPVNSDESTPINDGNVQIDPFSITINGKLELSNNGSGQTVDIMSEIKNNPILLRTISDMIVQNISSKYYGGRPVGNSNFRN